MKRCTKCKSTNIYELELYPRDWTSALIHPVNNNAEIDIEDMPHIMDAFYCHDCKGLILL